MLLSDLEYEGVLLGMQDTLVSVHDVIFGVALCIRNYAFS